LKKNNDLFICPLKKSNTWKDQAGCVNGKSFNKDRLFSLGKSIIQRKAWKVLALCALGTKITLFYFEIF